VLERAAEDAGAATRRTSAWVPVAPSEPNEPFRHVFPTEDRVLVSVGRRWARARMVSAARAEWALRRARGLEARAADLLAAEGIRGPLRGAGRVVRRTLGR
jgi:hypothetical protein